MENIAGWSADRSNPIVLEELVYAGIPVVQVEFMKGKMPEVPTTLIGLLHFADGTVVTFCRYWCYWVVRMNKKLPYNEAHELNTLMGGVVRVDGYSGGTNVSKDGCDNWSVNSQEGLVALARVLIHHFGKLATVDAPSVAELARLQLLHDAFYG